MLPLPPPRIAILVSPFSSVHEQSRSTPVVRLLSPPPSCCQCVSCRRIHYLLFSSRKQHTTTDGHTWYNGISCPSRLLWCPPLYYNSLEPQDFSSSRWNCRRNRLCEVRQSLSQISISLACRVVLFYPALSQCSLACPLHSSCHTSFFVFSKSSMHDTVTSFLHHVVA